MPLLTIEGMAAFLLVFFRMTGVTLSAPLFSNRSFPVQLRIWFAFFCALACFPLAWDRTEDGALLGLFDTPWGAALAVGSELSVGWALGWTVSVMVWGAQMAGHILGQEIGLSIGEVFDPVSEAQGSVVAQLFFTIGLLAFVILDGPELLLVAVSGSFEVAPPGSFPFGLADGAFLTRDLGGEVWRLGVKIALPGMVTLLLVTIAMAILARAVPEMNIFILGFAIRIVFGLLATLLVLPFVADLFRGFMETTSAALAQLMEMWG
ncbi:MAG: flagellar biosynthetic protein FliR [Planctomycetota bacterium]